MPGSPQWSLSLRFPHQNPVYTSPLPHVHYMPCPSHSKMTTQISLVLDEVLMLPDSRLALSSISRYDDSPCHHKLSLQQSVLMYNQRFICQVNTLLNLFWISDQSAPQFYFQLFVIQNELIKQTCSVRILFLSASQLIHTTQH
jgi:hypothetical protein